MAEEFDAETLDRMITYGGCDPRIPREIKDEVFEEWGGYNKSLPKFLDAINKAVARIPEDKRADAFVEIDGEVGHLTITYRRLQTPAEVAKNVRRALEYVRSQQASERATYSRLKAKFG